MLEPFSSSELRFMSFVSFLAMSCESPEITTKYALAPKEMQKLYRSGETITLGCIPGYRVVGNGTRECNEGNWTKIDFYCERKHIRFYNIK